MNPERGASIPTVDISLFLISPQFNSEGAHGLSDVPQRIPVALGFRATLVTVDQSGWQFFDWSKLFHHTCPRPKQAR